MSFESYHPSFQSLTGQFPSLDLLLEKDYPFAHEAGVYIATTNELFITSNRLGATPDNQHVKISRVSLGDFRCEEIAVENIAMANGGVNYEDGILFCAQGSRDSPSGLYKTAITPPYETVLLISDFHGRPFNSLNDVVVHSDGGIWFTDPSYGFEQGYRPRPRLPNQVYRYQPRDRSIRAVADGFGHPNGICFSHDEKIVYITDTDWVWGYGEPDDTRASTIYAFDLIGDPDKQYLANKRLFAMCDTGIPDGIKCDTNGNVYSGCGDGVNIWSDVGVLLGKILVPGGVANFCFGRGSELFLLNEKKLWRATLDSNVRGALLRLE